LTLRLSKGFPRAQARGRGINPAEPGAVVFVQRFGSAINLQTHS